MCISRGLRCQLGRIETMLRCTARCFGGSVPFEGRSQLHTHRLLQSAGLGKDQEQVNTYCCSQLALRQSIVRLNSSSCKPPMTDVPMPAKSTSNCWDCPRITSRTHCSRRNTCRQHRRPCFSLLKSKKRQVWGRPIYSLQHPLQPQERLQVPQALTQRDDKAKCFGSPAPESGVPPRSVKMCVPA